MLYVSCRCCFREHREKSLRPWKHQRTLMRQLSVSQHHAIRLPTRRQGRHCVQLCVIRVPTNDRIRFRRRTIIRCRDQKLPHVHLSHRTVLSRRRQALPSMQHRLTFTGTLPISMHVRPYVGVVSAKER